MKKIFTWIFIILCTFGMVFTYYACCGDGCDDDHYKIPRYYFTGMQDVPLVLNEYGLYLNPYTSNLDVLYKENSFFFGLSFIEKQANNISYGRLMTEMETISFRREIGDTIKRVYGYNNSPISGVYPDTLIHIDVITLADYGTYKTGNPINDLVILRTSGIDFSQTPWRYEKPYIPLVDFNNYKRADRKPCHSGFYTTIRKKDTLPSTYHRLNGLPLRVKVTYAKWRHLSDRPDDTTTIELKQYPYWFD